VGGIRRPTGFIVTAYGISQAVSGNEVDTLIGATTADLTIGYMGGRNESFHGDIDDVKILNYAVNSGQASMLAGSSVLNISYNDNQSYTIFTKNGTVYVDIDGYSASERISKSIKRFADFKRDEPLEGWGWGQ
jgi:hypothetical protein